MSISRPHCPQVIFFFAKSPVDAVFTALQFGQRIANFPILVLLSALKATGGKPNVPLPFRQKSHNFVCFRSYYASSVIICQYLFYLLSKTQSFGLSRQFLRFISVQIGESQEKETERHKYTSAVPYSIFPNSYKLQKNPHPPKKRDSRTLSQITSRPSQKTSPQDPRQQTKAKQDFRSRNGGGLVGKFSGGQGGLEGR